MNKKLQEYLQEKEFDTIEIESIIYLAENEADKKGLLEKIEYLFEIGLSKETIMSVLEENILFLPEELSTINKNVEILKQYVDKENFPIVIAITPEILTVKPEFLEQNLKLMKVLFPEKEDFEIILVNKAEIVTYNTDYLEKRLEFFIKNGLKDEIKNYIMEDIELFDVEEDEIDIEELKK